MLLNLGRIIRQSDKHRGKFDCPLMSTVEGKKNRACWNATYPVSIPPRRWALPDVCGSGLSAHYIKRMASFILLVITDITKLSHWATASQWVVYIQQNNNFPIFIQTRHLQMHKFLLHTSRCIKEMDNYWQQYTKWSKGGNFRKILMCHKHKLNRRPNDALVWPVVAITLRAIYYSTALLTSYSDPPNVTYCDLGSNLNLSWISTLPQLW